MGLERMIFERCAFCFYKFEDSDLGNSTRDILKHFHYILKFAFVREHSWKFVAKKSQNSLRPREFET